MWTEEIRQNLAKELNNQLDNKQFFDAKKYYSLNAEKSNEVSDFTNAPQKNLYINKNINIEDTIKGMAFSNKIPVEEKKTVSQLDTEKLKIYKISDLISENLMETVVIPIPENTTCTSLSLIKKFDWSDFLFSDLGTAWKMLKNRLK